jgi:mRNA interferase MazF
MVLKEGDVVVVDFPGVTSIKRRPAIVISTDTYHAHRPDIIVSLLTTQIGFAIAPTDYILQD